MIGYTELPILIVKRGGHSVLIQKYIKIFIYCNVILMLTLLNEILFLLSLMISS